MIREDLHLYQTSSSRKTPETLLCNCKRVEILAILECCVCLNSLSAIKCCLLITFENSVEPDQALQNVGPDLDPNV